MDSESFQDFSNTSAYHVNGGEMQDITCKYNKDVPTCVECLQRGVDHWHVMEYQVTVCPALLSCDCKMFHLHRCTSVKEEDQHIFVAFVCQKDGIMYAELKTTPSHQQLQKIEECIHIIDNRCPIEDVIVLFHHTLNCRAMIINLVEHGYFRDTSAVQLQVPYNRYPRYRLLLKGCQ